MLISASHVEVHKLLNETISCGLLTTALITLLDPSNVNLINNCEYNTEQMTVTEQTHPRMLHNAPTTRVPFRWISKNYNLNNYLTVAASDACVQAHKITA